MRTPVWPIMHLREGIGPLMDVTRNGPSRAWVRCKTESVPETFASYDQARVTCSTCRKLAATDSIKALSKGAST